MSPIRLNGSTSGYSQLDAPAIAGDQLFTLPGAGGTLVTADGTQTLTNKTYRGAGGAAWTGTVSQSGSSAVLEYGSNANGEYIRYADGTQICWFNSANSVSALQTIVNSKTFPIAFSATPRLVGSFAMGDADAIGYTSFSSNGVSNLNTTIKIVAQVPGSSGTGSSNCMAIGRWY